MIKIKDIEPILLSWYDVHKRIMPWRAVPGHAPNPYHVWLSEIMLQQTTVATVKDYFLRFITRWPTLDDLAKASLDEVLHAWQGLGYYSRARKLHECAHVLYRDFRGVIPQDEKVLLTLPGIGPYTAAAVSSIAYDQPTVPVDGNIVRVFSRLLSLMTPLPDLKKEVQSHVKTLIPSHRSGDFAQALMDLGATVCRPKNPLCQQCPLIRICKGYAQGIAAQLPFPAPKEKKLQRNGIIFWVENSHRDILLEKRPLKGLLGGLVGFPTTLWKEEAWDITCEEMTRYAPKGVQKWEPMPMIIRHTFTHFHLELKILKGQTNATQTGFWCPLNELDLHALPTVMKKVIQAVGGVGSFSFPK